MDNLTLSEMIGGRIVDIARICDLISVEILTLKHQKIYIHIQSFFRVLRKGKVVISSEDMYKCGKNVNAEHFNWDQPGNSVYDDSLKKYLLEICQSTISAINQNYNRDLIIFLKNDIVLQILIDTAESEEKYRIFTENYEFVFNT